MKPKTVLIGSIAIGLLSLLFGKPAYKAVESAIRGIRNNNPGNIRISNIAWKGKVPVSQNTDGAFEQFTTLEYGISALVNNLLAYHKKGLNTIEKIISTWAPSSENNTKAYINSVTQRTNLAANKILTTDKDTLYKLTKAISYHENGKDIITPENFNKAYTI